MNMRISNTLQVVAIVLALVYTSSAAVLPKRNTTITVPDGITYHQDSESICTPTSWTDILTFFFGNYVAHAASTVTLPGESSFGNIQNMFVALLWPAQGVRRGMLVIFRRAVFWKDPLQQAHRAAALCMVVRSRRWKPEPGEPVRSMAFWPQIARREDASESTGKRPWTSRIYSKIVDLDYILSKPDGYTPRQFYVMHRTRKKESGEHIKKLEQGYYKTFEVIVDTPSWCCALNSFLAYGVPYPISSRGSIFGDYKLPSGYEFCLVPPHACVESLNDPNMSAEVIIQPSYSASSALIALLQVLYAASTLYESKGYQISRYGYAAFGFTVLPYLVMSVMNLVGTLVTPNYPSAYLVHTEIMDEAIKRGGHFNTIVGKLESDGLPVKEFYVFGGSFQPQKDSNNLWNLKLTSKIFNIDETEPLLDNTQNMQQGVVVSHATVASQEQDTSNISSASSPPENEQKKPSRYQPRIIVPSCYNFKQIPPSPPINVPIGFMFWSISPRTLIATWLRWFISAIPLIAIGVISHFKPESSTLAERVWIMLWLIMGMVVDPHPYFADYVIGLYLDRPAAFRRIFEKDRYHNRLDFYGDLWGLTSRTFTTIVYNLVANAVSIGRIVVVWQMLDAYGSCTSLD